MQHNRCYDLTTQFFLYPFFVTAKCEFVSGARAPNRNVHRCIGIHLPTKLAYEVFFYTLKYQYVHDDIKDGTICVLQLIRTPQEYRKSRGFNKIA